MGDLPWWDYDNKAEEEVIKVTDREQARSILNKFKKKKK